MRYPRRPLVGMMLAALTLTLAPVAASGVTTPSSAGFSAASRTGVLVAARRHKKHRHHRHHRARGNGGARPENFTRQSVRATRGYNSISLTWPARLRATGYTVTWFPNSTNTPTSPWTCHSPCQHKFTRYTSMRLTSSQLSTYGRRVSSASGNTVRFKIFSHNGTAMNWTGTTYPWDAWVAPSQAATTNWLPVMNSQMPLPLAPKSGRQVAISSFNLLSASAGGWSTRGPRAANQIKSTGASIVATQENSNSATGVPGGISQYQDMANKLRGSGWALADGRDWDKTLGLSRSWSSQATRIYYKTSQWSQLANGALLTHSGVYHYTSGVNVDRWVSWTKLRSTADAGTKLCVIDAHLLTNLGHYDVASANHRNTEVAQILSQLNNPNSTIRHVGTRVGAACAGTPTVMAGDFNSAQAHSPYGDQPQATFLNNGFVDTKNAAARYNTRFDGPGTVGRWHSTWGTQIDYLLTRGMGGARTFKVNAVTPSAAGSDHYPITSVVDVPRS